MYGEYFGDWVELEPCYRGCNNCGAEYLSVGELRWCPSCQSNIFDEGMEEYRRLVNLLHDAENY